MRRRVNGGRAGAFAVLTLGLLLCGCSLQVHGRADTSGPPSFTVTTDGFDGEELQAKTQELFGEGPKTPGSAGNPAAEELAASVVRLEVYDGKGAKIATGTGFAFGDPVRIATSAHVIVNMDYALATRDDGSSFRIEAPAVYADPDLDLAVLPLPEGASLTPLPIAEELPPRGSPVTAIGSQAGLVNLVTVGNMSGVWEQDGRTYLIFTAPVSSGNSGGPLFDENGAVTGIVIGTYDKAQNLNIALSAKYLSEEAL